MSEASLSSVFHIILRTLTKTRALLISSRGRTHAPGIIEYGFRQMLLMISER